MAAMHSERDRLRRWLGLDEDRVLVEQLRLVYSGMTASLLPMFPTMALLVFILHDGTNLDRLLLWYLGLGANNIFMIVEARHRLAHGFAPGQALRLVVRMMLSIAVGGFAWGVLAWGALGNTTLGGNVLVVGVLAGILGGAVSLLSPVQPVFVCLAIPLVGTTVLRLWQLDDPAFNAFGVIAMIYVAVMIVHARIASRTVRAAVELRFENLELVRQANAARAQAEEANTAKSRFLAAASHDLRQPIHAQGLFLEVLGHTALTPQQGELLASVRQSRDTTAEMLNVLLDFSRIEAGVVQPRVQPFRVQPLLNKLEREFSAQADAKGLVYRSRETPLAILSDPSLIELVLRNFISNAIRYTERGGLLVTCRRRGGLALLEVRDTGIGIALAQQKEVFREFHQLANPERDSRKGLGLGLAISDRLAQTLGHTLTLKSVPGQGSTFALEVPSCDTAQPAAEAVTGPQATGMTGLHGLNVLLIDDELSIRTGMGHLLGSWGCNHRAAESVEEALSTVEVFPPDVVVTDFRLREQATGAQAIAVLRAQLGQDLPCVIITGDTAPERLREAMASGAALLHKPVAPQELYQVLATVQTGFAAIQSESLQTFPSPHSAL